MNTPALRIFKEVRLIFWTWIAVVALALLPAFTSSSYLAFAGAVGFLIGVPLLAAIPFGSELEDGTLSLLLSQPITRIQIWFQKFAVSVVAVISAFLAFAFVSRTTLFTPLPTLVWALAALCSGPYCALIARSVRGGVALNLISFALVFMWSQLSLWSRPETVFVLWGGLMLVLGIRKMARFELTSGHVGGDLLTVGPRLRVFRSQPAGAVRNFIRKELGLLRPLWLVTVSFLVIWTVLGVWHHPTRYWASSNFVVAALYQTMSILLAGSLSIGEEKLSGMHPWHLTLPMSTFRQWLTKLVVAVSASVLCAAAIPYFLTLILQLGTPSITETLLYAVSAAVLTFAVFWSSCLVSGTIRAILVSVILMAVLVFTAGVGLSVRVFHDPLGFAQVLIPTLAVALVQSYRVFRVQPPQTTASFLRYLLPLAATVLVFSVLNNALISTER